MEAAGQSRCHTDRRSSVGRCVHARNECLRCRSIGICESNVKQNKRDERGRCWDHLPECVSLLNGALCHKRNTIVILRTTLMNTMPMQCRLHAFHVIFHIDDNLIVFAHLYTGPGNHTICRQNTTFHTIGQHALAVTPHGIRCIRCAHLTSTERNWEKKRNFIFSSLRVQFTVSTSIQPFNYPFIDSTMRTKLKRRGRSVGKRHAFVHQFNWVDFYFHGQQERNRRLTPDPKVIHLC